jgi:glutamate N-acetyltransferase/amino-acid N-acetyltransferase
MAAIAAHKLKTSPDKVIVASTGKIGVPMNMRLIRNGLVEATDALSEKNIESVAKAIMTTDLTKKMISVKVGKASIVGIAKGSGMIHPNMATMLAFIMTDARVTKTELQKALKQAVDVSFNMITVDGDTSTNDMCTVMANGLAGEVNTATFTKGLLEVCTYLAKEMARDGEGATKLIEVEVKHAATQADAIKAAKAVAGSPLVKTAVHGADPNWGRVAAAVGYSGAEVDPDTMVIKMLALSSKEPKIHVDLKKGKFEAVAWGCDLTKGYIDINTKYN